MITLKKNGIWFTPNMGEEKPKKLNSVLRHLGDVISIDDDFTFGDFFKVLKDYEQIYGAVFAFALGNFSLKPFFDDIEKIGEESKDKVKFIEIFWGAEQFEYKGSNEISIYPSVCGSTSKKNLKNKQAYGIDFTPLYQLKDLPIFLNKKFELYPMWKKGMKNDTYKPVVKGYKEFTVYEVFSAILDEISFMGVPKERDSAWEELKGRVDECKKTLKKDKKK